MIQFRSFLVQEFIVALQKIITINLDTSSDNNNSDSDNNTSDSSSTPEEIDYDSPENKGPPKSLLKWYGYLSSKAKVQACGLKAKLQTSRSKAKLQTSPKTPIVKSLVPITNYGLGLANAKTWDAILSKTFRVKIPPKIIVLSSNSSDDRKGPSKESVPIFEGPSIQGLLDHYGYNDIEEYLSWNYFLSTNKENTDKDITDNDIIDEDCIHKSKYAMSKGKYVPVSQKHNPKVKSHVPVTGCVLRLANITTWDEIVDKIGVRKSEIYADKAKGKRKVSYGSWSCSC
ncbi:hypothetical protein Tco_1368305 [Tanacetum coccineum]